MEVGESPKVTTSVLRSTSHSVLGPIEKEGGKERRPFIPSFLPSLSATGIDCQLGRRMTRRNSILSELGP